MKQQYVVKFTKFFTSGSLKGLTFDSSVSFPTLETASGYVSFLNKHHSKPVKSRFDSCDFTCHLARIETISLDGPRAQ